jgi:hypothetical protein
MEARINEIAAAAESFALSAHRCADAVEQLVDHLLDPDPKQPLKWPRLVVTHKEGGAR